MPAPSTRPTGQPGGLTPAWSTIAGVGEGYAAAGWEENPDLAPEYRIRMYDRMRRTDGQIASMAQAVTWPIRRTTWTLNTTGVDPAVAAFVQDQFNLDGGEHLQGGLNWPEHLRELLLALWWGYAPFERWWEYGPGRTPGAPKTIGNLKVGLRPATTVQEIRVNPDGTLAGLIQLPITYDTSMTSGTHYVSAGSAQTGRDLWMPARDLAFYCFEREGADWQGTSLLRAAYKDWYLKELHVRASAQGTERNSMGIPAIGYDNPDDRAEAERVGREYRAGAEAFIAYDRTKLSVEILGVNGTLADPTPKIEYHDRQMTRRVLAMFLDLGHDAGARSLGETFADFFAMSLNTIADWAAISATVNLIRPMVDRNFGPGRPIPVLQCEEITAGQSATAEALGILAEKGIITPDGELEAQQRRAYGLPERAGAANVVQGPAKLPGNQPAGDTFDRAVAAAERLAALSAARR